MHAIGLTSIDALGSITADLPQTGTPLLSFLPQPLELAALGVSEAGGAGEPQLYEILVEEVFVEA